MTELFTYLNQCLAEMQESNKQIDKSIKFAIKQGVIMPELENTDERESQGHE